MKCSIPCAAVLFLCSFSCNTTDPPPPGESPVQFAAIDASCTEVWLSVRFHSAAQPRTFEIRRDTLPILTTTLTGTDTLIVDEGLLPNREYTYTLTRPGVWQSQPLTAMITTMDTTSHDWIFDPPVLLGDGSSSVLYDVCILSDTLAYAVGAVYKLDSLGNWDPLPYNLVKWDGQQWELKRVSVLYRGNLITPPLNAVFAFSPTDIWLSSGVPIHGNGQTWTQYHLFDMGILTQNDGSLNKIWGSSSELWFVGNRGTIVHRSPSGTWRRVESGMEIDIKDVWGSHSTRTNKLEIACIASFGGAVPQARKLLAIVNGTALILPDSGLPLNLSSIWFHAGTHYYLSGSGIFRKRTTMLNELPWVSLHGGVTTFHTRAIRGNALNDVFLSGAFGEVLHFNGVNFRSYRQSTMLGNGSYHAIAMQGNLVVTVGSDAAVAIGRRN